MSTRHNAPPSRLFRRNSLENAKISVPKRLNIYICSFYYKNVSPGSTAPDERAKSTSSLTHVRSVGPTPGGRRAVLFSPPVIPASLVSFPLPSPVIPASLPSFPRKRESTSLRTTQPPEAKTARHCQNRDFQDFAFAHLAAFAITQNLANPNTDKRFSGESARRG